MSNDIFILQIVHKINAPVFAGSGFYFAENRAILRANAPDKNLVL